MQGVEADISYEQPYTQHPYGISGLSIAIGANGQSYPYIQAGFDANHATTGGATFPFYQIGYGPGNVDTVFLQVGPFQLHSVHHFIIYWINNNFYLWLDGQLMENKPVTLSTTPSVAQVIYSIENNNSAMMGAWDYPAYVANVKDYQPITGGWQVFCTDWQTNPRPERLVMAFVGSDSYGSDYGFYDPYCPY